MYVLYEYRVDFTVDDIIITATLVVQYIMTDSHGHGVVRPLHVSQKWLVTKTLTLAFFHLLHSSLRNDMRRGELILSTRYGTRYHPSTLLLFLSHRPYYSRVRIIVTRKARIETTK
jgi:hypothetical protein